MTGRTPDKDSGAAVPSTAEVGLRGVCLYDGPPMYAPLVSLCHHPLPSPKSELEGVLFFHPGRIISYKISIVAVDL